MTARKTTAKEKTVIGKKPAKRKTPIKKDLTNPNSKYTNKNEAEKNEIKCMIAMGMQKAKGFREITEIIKDSGLSCGTSTFYQYVKEIRAEWREMVSESYETHVASQFAKLDRMEATLWVMLDKSMQSEKKDTVNTEKGVIVGRKEESKTRSGDVEIMLAIERIWVRRNEILGITSSTINIQNNIQNNIETTTTTTNVEVNKVEQQPIANAFFGNFIIKQAERSKQ